MHFDSSQVMTHNKVLALDKRHIYPGTIAQAALRLKKEKSVPIYSPEMDSEILSFLERYKLHMA
jgi:hypothetical protein